MYIDHNLLFSGHYISALRECCNLKFLHPLEIDQGLLARTPTGTGVPPTKFNCKNLKFGLKFSMCTPIALGLVGIFLWNLYQSTCRRAGVTTCVQFSEGPPPKIWESQKTSEFRRDFWQLSTLVANISGTGGHIKNLKSSWSTTASPRLDKRNLVNFGPHTKKL